MSRTTYRSSAAVLSAIGLTATVLVLAACTGGTAATPTKTLLPGDTVVTSPEAAGDVDSIVWALSAGEPPTLDPQRSADYSPKTVVANMCESLTIIQADGSVEMNLATSVASPDELTFVADIKPGITFWDGSPLTADDVVFSLGRNIGAESTSPYGSDFINVASIEKSGDLQVTLRLSAPDPLLPTKLATTGASISEASVAEAAGDQYGTASGGVMCTGPYQFESWTPGRNIVITRNNNWWNTATTPHVQSVQFEFIGDNDTLATALLSGDIDGAYDVPTGSLASLSESTVGSLYRGKSTISVVLGPTSTTGPGADPAFRAALNLAIDKEAIAAIAAGGAGSPMRSLVAPFVWSGDPAAATYDAGYEELPSGRDLDAAKAKLAEMREPLDGPVSLAIIAGNQLMERSATLVQANAAEIGVQIDIEQLQPAVYTSIYADPSVREQYDLFASSGAFVEIPSPLYWAPLFVADWSPYNYSKYDDPEVTSLLNEALLSPDPQVQADLYTQAQAIFAVEGPIIGLTTVDELVFMNDRISGAPVSSFYLNVPWAAHIGGTSK